MQGLAQRPPAASWLSLLMLALALQLRSTRYVPWIYWLTVVLVSVVGTQITDALTDVTKVSLYYSTIVFAINRGNLCALVRVRADALNPDHRYAAS